MSNDYLVTVFTVVIMVNFSLLVWLGVAVYRLQQKLLELERSVDRNGKDLAGLCTAAVNVDSRLNVSDEQLNKLAVMLTEIEQNGSGEVGPEVHSYQRAIAKIQQGAGIDELIQDCGLSHEEAQLLSRLHAR